MSDIALINDSQQSAIVTNGIGKNGEIYMKAAGSTDAGALVVYDAGNWRKFEHEASSSFSNAYNVELDGVDDYATISSTFSALSGNKSITGWFYFDSTTSQTIFAKVGASSFSHEGWLLLTATNIRFRVGSTRHIFTVPALSTGTWYHLAVTGDGTDLKLYINGVQQGGTKVDGDWSIGEFFKTQIHYHFNVYVDEIGLWTGTTLSSSDVLAIANLSAASGDKAVDLSTYTGLTHWWRFGDGDTSPTVSDNVGSNDMTLINSPTFVTQIP
jgi:hypothetical protein